MSSILHITNGDSFTGILNTLNIKGDVITWREMLCEGKTTEDVGSESFWKTRFDFLNKSYNVTKKHFIEKTLKEYRSLCNHKKQDQIVLWFEYDLFCQINMLAVISWLKQHRPYAEVSVVCSGKEDDTDKLYGLSELSKAQLLTHYQNKTILTKDDIEYAAYVWQLYCSNNPIRLEAIAKDNNSKFTYLSSAIAAHLKRFPSLNNGLNTLENIILNTANTQKLEAKEQLVGKVLKNQENYGFGDTQIFKTISNLKPLFTSFNPIKLSKNGKLVLENSLNFYGKIRNDDYLGGTLKYSYLYNHQNDKLLKL